MPNDLQGMSGVHNNLETPLSDKAIRESDPPFQKAIELLPDYAMAHNNLGSALAAVVKHKLPTNIFSRPVNSTNYLEAQFNVGNSLVILKRPEEARRVFTAILDKDPNYQYARWALEKLNKSAP